MEYYPNQMKHARNSIPLPPSQGVGAIGIIHNPGAQNVIAIYKLSVLTLFLCMTFWAFYAVIQTVNILSGAAKSQTGTAHPEAYAEKRRLRALQPWWSTHIARKRKHCRC
ncbi:hypothetical protein Zmor_028532 [Zophobas morio]|uniref:Uncharacterized protein n=1 Tax=Zophobas morio TaxID=2755281 RepID=A0AA38HKY3_9CUCU|nr:hypothetical protein Zmor_028532 [Zophobas morio]